MRAVITAVPALIIVALPLACTVVETPDDNPFATGTPTMTSTPPGTDSGSGSGSGSGGSGEGDTSSGGPGSSDGVDSTGALTTGPMTTGVSMGSTDDGGGNGMQPAMGMYSACEIPEDCGFSPTLCITIVDDMDVLIAGFCSETGCANPAVDCSPSPNGVVTPVCVPVTVNGMADNACALQCTGGQACPAPMQCINVTGFGEVCA
ncbi:hypothetical protein [Paraliomyxa miuraensis]|uniref:hypothetical protein n=1 Tax=Paraliomyxa miuraensis TaxID=376150 RepID=UPI00224CB72D|nr:hypothetical protein [Paraliomyxa miuraensis]MCX4243175.1 hypothetical protein [Paraliomyxa miuraensis]